MNLINQKGIDLLQYKEELLKDYPKLVKDSLYLALETMVNNNVISLDAYQTVKNEDISNQELEQFLLSKAAFRKSEEEIFQEYEIIRTGLDKVMEAHGLRGVQSESIVDKNLMLVTKKFCIDEDFTKRYFGVSKDSDVMILMKRKGFVYKFAALRLVAIFNSFMEGLEYSQEHFHCDVSLPYNETEKIGYAIDLYFELSLEDLEKNDPEKINAICDEMKRITELAQAHFDAKTVA